MSKTRIITLLAFVAILVAPTQAQARCDQHHPLECRKAAHYWRAEATRAHRAVAWQRAQAKHAADQLLGAYAEPIAAARLAYAVCVAYLGANHSCPPPRETLLIGRCESGLQEHDPNPVSTADGPHQYLYSTWLGAGFSAFPRTSFLPSFLAIELFGANHSRTYSPWRPSIGCHHLR